MHWYHTSINYFFLELSVSFLSSVFPSEGDEGVDSSDLTGSGTVSGTSSLAEGVVGVFGGGVSLSCDDLTFGRITCCTGLSVSL